MLIIPPQMALYMALAPEQKLTYPLAGPAGPAAFNAGMQGFEAQSFRGLGVFTSTPVCAFPPAHASHHIAHLFRCLALFLGASFQEADRRRNLVCLFTQYEVSDGARFTNANPTNTNMFCVFQN